MMIIRLFLSVLGNKSLLLVLHLDAFWTMDLVKRDDEMDPSSP